MDRDRRERLTSVLHPLAACDSFSPDEAKRLVRESVPGFVTRTINHIARDGILIRVQEESGARFHWVDENRLVAIDRWIESQIHGDQVKETPEYERPRERLMRLGAASLTTAELLAILIRVGVRNESATTGGRKLANRFAERIEGLRTASLSELREISRAATKASYCQIMAGIELGRRVEDAEKNRPHGIPRITSTAEAVDYCAAEFAYLAADAVQEEFHIVTLDTKHKPIQSHRITVGTLDASLVHPREVFRPAIRDAASAVLLVHNHPSGDPTPSREDIQVTNRLTEAGDLVGISVLDHIIVAKENSLSIREQV